MKIVMTLFVRDCADILRANLEYHLSAGIDHFIATDNGSVDGTTEILKEYAGRGRLHYLHEPRHLFDQGRWHTRMAGLAAEAYGADWILHNDEDEFWWPEAGGDLRDAFEAVPDTVAGLRVARHNYVPRPCSEGKDFLAALPYRETASRNYVGKPLPPKVCHRAMVDIVVGQGNHAIFQNGQRMAFPITDQVCIFHYPYRSRPQFRKKIIRGGTAYARSDLPPQVGYTTRTLYDLHLRGALDAYLDEAEFDDDRIAEALADGRIVEDTRLRDLFVSRGLAR